MSSTRSSPRRASVTAPASARRPSRPSGSVPPHPRLDPLRGGAEAAWMEPELRIAPARRRRSAPERASAIAARQFGAIARRQLESAGFTASRIDRWLRSGRLHRRYPGVYAVGRADLAVEGELACG